MIGNRTLERLDKDEYTDEERTEAEEIAEQRRIEEEEKAVSFMHQNNTLTTSLDIKWLTKICKGHLCVVLRRHKIFPFCF